MTDKLIIEELTIFETLLSFDESRANWKRNEDRVVYCEVLAYVPSQALPTKFSPKNKRENFQYELWEYHCLAIWLYNKCDWDRACYLLNEHRESEIPIGMRIYRQYIHDWFQATQIAEYL